jgi:type II secretory ATPase GspE/PulE/Tfp pilus assembly ATPase PilB-like protein
MIGEIRDNETADIAVKAALTGHQVLSTLHTNDAAGAITRLDDMGIEPFLISSSILLTCAQRLVRRICPNCREEFNPSPNCSQSSASRTTARLFTTARAATAASAAAISGAPRSSKCCRFPKSAA